MTSNELNDTLRVFETIRTHMCMIVCSLGRILVGLFFTFQNQKLSVYVAADEICNRRAFLHAAVTNRVGSSHAFYYNELPITLA